MQDAEKFVASSRQFSYSGGCCRSDTNEPQPCPATRCPNGTDAEISPDFANTLYSGQGPPCTRIDPPIVMSGSPLWFGFLRVNRAGKHIGIHISRIVRGVRLLSSLVAALPRWDYDPASIMGLGMPTQPLGLLGPDKKSSHRYGLSRAKPESELVRLRTPKSC